MFSLENLVGTAVLATIVAACMASFNMGLYLVARRLNKRLDKLKADNEELVGKLNQGKRLAASQSEACKRLALMAQDIGHKYGISQNEVLRIFNETKEL